jgi:tRNA pseudouridine55 synthase
MKTAPMSPESGLLILNKESGLTSFDALRGVKRAFKTGKVGHTGTLDKFASGLLAALVGKAVKLVPYTGKGEKEYRAVIRFGAETDTLDPEGAITAEGPVPSRAAVEAVLPQFRGAILQAPPAYSAVHVEGGRAYEIARSGKTPEMEKRPVTIYRLELLSFEAPEAAVRVVSSAGTYIRSLARDIALAAGSRAYVTSLTRTRIGGFTLEDAPASRTGDDGAFKRALKPLGPEVLEKFSIPCLWVDPGTATAMIHGKPLEPLLRTAKSTTPPQADGVWTLRNESGSGDVSPALGAPADGFFGIFREGEDAPLVAVVERKKGRWYYGHVFAGPHPAGDGAAGRGTHALS